ncbi:MAG: cytochrome c biogenesis protein CcdA [Patescibacteria group bacterium]
MIESPNLAIAFLAGLVSFFTPCVVIIVPVFLANLAGVKLDQSESHEQAGQIRRATWLFVLGFAVTFTIFGAVSGLLAQQFVQFNKYFSVVAGALMIFFGLTIAEVIKIDFLQRTFRLPVGQSGLRNRFYPLLMGVTFAAGWTPCVGPVLAAILLLAGESASAGVGSIYLLSYSVGLMLPFLLAGYAIGRAQKLVYKISPYLGKIRWLTASIIIILGLLLMTQNLGRLLSYFYFLVPPKIWSGPVS